MRRTILLLLSAAGLIVLLLLGGWSWVLVAKQPLEVPISGWLPWPVVCSTRGCITTWSWARQQTATEVFAKLSGREQPSTLQSLTTLVRQHLAHFGQLKSPITLAAAQRYRTEILHATEDQKIQEATGLTLAAYDELVIMPFLEQESLRQQRRAESVEDLYAQLAGERWIVALPWHLTWSKQEARVKEQ